MEKVGSIPILKSLGIKNMLEFDVIGGFYDFISPNKIFDFMDPPPQETILNSLYRHVKNEGKGKGIFMLSFPLFFMLFFRPPFLTH